MVQMTVDELCCAMEDGRKKVVEFWLRLLVLYCSYYRIIQRNDSEGPSTQYNPGSSTSSIQFMDMV